jgi:hypothetical protein
MLRDMGFRGSFPHFRRARGLQLDLLVFQFSRWGGSFVVELGYCPVGGYTSLSGEHYPPNKVQVHHLHYQQRLRLGSRRPEVADHWFQFAPDATAFTPRQRTGSSALTFAAEHFWSHP